MNAKEILEKYYKNYAKRIAFDEQVLDAMIEYAKQKCKEQREICALNNEMCDASHDEINENAIINSPEPDFD